MFTIIFPVLNERLRLENGVTRTVEYLQSIAFEDYEWITVPRMRHRRSQKSCAKNMIK